MPETECEFKAECEKEMKIENVYCERFVDKEKCESRNFALAILNSPQFKKQYKPLKDVEEVLRGLPVWQDDFQLEKVLNLIRRIE